MLTSAVIYQSKYGSTQKYAEWIAEDAGASLYRLPDVSPVTLKQYSTLVFGGGLYASKMQGAAFIKSCLPLLPDQKILVFFVGARPETPEMLQAVIDRNFDAAAQKRLHFFYLRGALRVETLAPKHRFTLSMLNRMTANKKLPKDASYSKGLPVSLDTDIDYVSREAIAPILSHMELLTQE
jgi:menaquinone-dependent protoporphyrinogen IX oxidase